ncbi:ImmA/IrrE family metallo-endopeptidase [Bacillota bacterium Meth-B3]
MDFLKAIYKQYGIILDEEILKEDGHLNGLAVGANDKPPIVLLRPNMAEGKKRFIMAHELGHHLAGHNMHKQNAETIENEANTFAAVLIAMELFMKYWQPIAGEVQT